MPTSKGNGKYIETPEKLWQLWCEYKKYCKDNPIIKIDFRGKEAERVEIPVERPRTIEGFGEYLRDRDIIKDVEDYFINKNGAYDDYSGICTRIRSERTAQQIEYGLTGHYNANLTARLNQLSDHQTNTFTGKINVFPTEQEFFEHDKENNQS